MRNEVGTNLICLNTKIDEEACVSHENTGAKDADGVCERSGNHPEGEPKDDIQIRDLSHVTCEAACDRGSFQVEGHAQDTHALAIVSHEEQACRDTSREGIPCEQKRQDRERDVNPGALRPSPPSLIRYLPLLLRVCMRARAKGRCML